MAFIYFANQRYLTLPEQPRLPSGCGCRIMFMGLGERVMRKGFAIAAASAMVLGACAGRTPAPVAVVQPQDRYMDCAAITAEVQANNNKVSELGSEQGLKTTQNVAAGVAGFVIPILWFGMDWQGAQSKEVAALQSRQQYLATLAETRSAPAPAVVQSQPPIRRQASKPATPGESGEGTNDESNPVNVPCIVELGLA